MEKLKKNKWVVLIYLMVAGGSLFCYFNLRLQLANFNIQPFVLSNFTLNYLLLMLIWGAIAPSVLFKRFNFILRWVLTLVGFVLILGVLTLGGLHTRLTDWFGGVR